MLVMIGADIASTGRKLPRRADGPLDPLLSPDFALPGEIKIDTLPDQIGYRSSGSRRRLPKGFQLPVR
jgi:hypothetical protein